MLTPRVNILSITIRFHFKSGSKPRTCKADANQLWADGNEQRFIKGQCANTDKHTNRVVMVGEVGVCVSLDACACEVQDVATSDAREAPLGVDLTMLSRPGAGYWSQCTVLPSRQCSHASPDLLTRLGGCRALQLTKSSCVWVNLCSVWFCEVLLVWKHENSGGNRLAFADFGYFFY